MIVLGCSSAQEDEAEESIDAALSAAQLSVSLAEVKSGRGLVSCDQSSGSTLCLHRDGLVLLTDKGVALLKANNNHVELGILPHQAKNLADAVASLRSFSSSAPGGLTPQGATSTALAAVRRAVSAALRPEAKSAAVRAGNATGVGHVARAPGAASEVTSVVRALAHEAPPVFTLRGTYSSDIYECVNKWRELMPRRVISLRLDKPGQEITPSMVASFADELTFEMTHPRPLDGRLTLLLPRAESNFEALVWEARIRGFDVVTVGVGPMKPTAAHVNAHIDVALEGPQDDVISTALTLFANGIIAFRNGVAVRAY